MRSFYKYMVIAFVAIFASPAFAAPVDDASKFVETLGNSAVATLTNKTLTKEDKRTQLETLFHKNVDIAWVGKFVLGRFWKQATDDQKSRYLQQYGVFLTNHYAARFSDYSSGSFKITGAKDEGNNEFTISMQIQSGEAGGNPVLVDYKIRQTDKNFSIFDIIVEGVSMITTQRSEFASVLANNGMDYLITQLASKSTVAAN